MFVNVYSSFSFVCVSFSVRVIMMNMQLKDKDIDWLDALAEVVRDQDTDKVVRHLTEDIWRSLVQLSVIASPRQASYTLGLAASMLTQRAVRYHVLSDAFDLRLSLLDDLESI